MVLNIIKSGLIERYYFRLKGIITEVSLLPLHSLMCEILKQRYLRKLTEKLRQQTLKECKLKLVSVLICSCV